MNTKDLHNDVKFNCFILRVYSVCVNEYHTYLGLSRFPLCTIRNIEKCFLRGMDVEKTTLYINTH